MSMAAIQGDWWNEPETVGDWSKSAKSADGSKSAKSAKSEWEGVGDWSKSAKSDDGSAKASKSEWEGIGEWSKVRTQNIEHVSAMHMNITNSFVSPIQPRSVSHH